MSLSLPTAQSPLCTRCAGLNLLDQNVTFRDTVEGLKGRKFNCALCKLLLSWCLKRRQDGNPNRLSEAGRYSAIIEFQRHGSYLTTKNKHEHRVASLNWASHVPFSHGVQAGFPKPSSPDSALHKKLLSSWIEACDRDHSCFPASGGPLPTRLVEVGSPSGVDSGDDTVRLLYATDDIPSSSHYVALSHRWGSPHSPSPSPQKHEVQQGHGIKQQTVRTTRKRDTLGPRGEALTDRGIHLSDLPNTFRDAILVTRSLGVPYLWIDSLCIVQDDPEDWNRESQLMERVFSNAYCVIAATRASGTDAGFLKDRTREIVVMRQGIPETQSPLYVCEMVDDFEEHVNRSALQRRGWVLQERALSRRTIHFAEHQTYWECGEGIRCETLMKTKNDKAAFLGDADFPRYTDSRSKGKRIKLIQGLYEQYSSMGLTYPRDRPTAIRGLEVRLGRTIGGGAGAFGIFRDNMHRYLLWRRSSSTGIGLARVTDFPPTPPAPPSWSWMAYSGEIEYMDVPGRGVEWNTTSLVWPPLDSLLPPRLEVHVQDILDLNGEDTCITMDDSRVSIPRQGKCVVVGTLMVQTPHCWVLLVGPVEDPALVTAHRGKRHAIFKMKSMAPPPKAKEANNVKKWQRLGVGKVRKEQITFGSSGEDHQSDWIV